MPTSEIPWLASDNPGFGQVSAADDLLHPDINTGDFTETETYWFNFYVPERKLSGAIYCWMHKKLNTCTSGVWIWQGVEARGTLLYDIRNYRPTYGALQSYLTSIMPAGAPALRDGRVVRYPLAAFAGMACGIGGVHGIFPDAIVISRYWPAKRLDALLKGGVGARPLIAALAALIIRPTVRDLIFRLPFRKWTAYQPQNDLKSTVTAPAEIVGGDGARVTRSLKGEGIYPLTGQVMVATLQAMAARNKTVGGVRAASEMYDDLEMLLSSVSIKLL